MRTIRHTATALLTSVLLFTSCSTELPPDEGGEETPAVADGGPTAEVRPVTVAFIDELMEAREFGRVVELLGDQGEAGSLELELAERLVQALWAQDEVPRAVRVGRATLERHPDATRTSRILAEIYLSLNQYAKSVDVLRAARASGASDADIALALGVCLGRMEDLDGARAEFELAAQAGAPRASVDYNLAVLLINRDQHGEAETLLRGVVTEQPENLDAQRELARVLLCQRPDEDGRREEAVACLNIVLDERANDWRAYELMGDVYMDYDDPEAAVSFYTEALRHGRNPKHVEGKYLVAAQAQKELLEEQGLLPEVDPEEKRPSPPIPLGVQERWKQAAKDQAAQGESAPVEGEGSAQDQGR